MATDAANDEGQGVFVPDHWVPVPPTISPQARAGLSNPGLGGSAEALPKLTDTAAWRAHIAASTTRLTEALKPAFDASGCTLETRNFGQFAIYELTPPNLAQADHERAICYIHGGAFLYGGGLCAAYMAGGLAAATGLRSFSVDYRMPPDDPYPAGLDDCVDAYRWMLERHAPEHIAVAGSSAGGGLAASTILKARDQGLPLPGACVLGTPEVDLTESGDSFETNWLIDVVLKQRLTDTIALYAGGHDLTHPYLSPVLADFSQGFAPTILTSGTRDLFLSNTVRMHRALLSAGIEAELHVWEAMPHGGFSGAPEDREVLAQQARFIRGHLGARPLD